jgi:hypothetical protein
MRLAPRGATAMTLRFDVDANGAIDALDGTKRRCTNTS